MLWLVQILRDSRERFRGILVIKPDNWAELGIIEWKDARRINDGSRAMKWLTIDPESREKEEEGEEKEEQEKEDEEDEEEEEEGMEYDRSFAPSVCRK